MVQGQQELTQLKSVSEKRKNLGIEKYTKKVINETPVGKGLKWIGTDDKKLLVIKFNTAYYLAKNERPFNDYPEL